MNIQLIIVLQIYIWSIIKPVTSDANCPDSSYEISNGICVFKVGRATKFCMAFEMCKIHGQQVNMHLTLIGRNYLFLQKYIKVKSGFWTSINCCASKIQDPNEIMWMDDYPDNANITDFYIRQTVSKAVDSNSEIHAIVYVNSGGMIDFTKRSRKSALDVFCQYNPKLYLPNIRLIKSSMLPVDDQLPPYSDDSKLDGCYVIHRSPSIIQCAFKCYINQNCRMVFYNSSSEDCLLVMHIQSNLPSRIFKSKYSWTVVKPITI